MRTTRTACFQLLRRALLLCVCAAAGCGGRSASSGAGTGTAGAAGACTGSCPGWPGLACGIGFVIVQEPGACCPTCVPNGSGDSGGSAGAGGAAVDAGSAGCASLCVSVGIDCVPGTHLETLPGACCPTCVPDDACAQGQAAYSAERSKLLAESSLACQTMADCAYLQDDARCGYGCSVTPVSVTAAPSLEQELSTLAQTECANCSAVYPPCAAPLPLACKSGQCVTGSFVSP